MTAHKQTTDGNAYTTGYAYNLSGALIEETYPSGRVVKNVLDNNGDLSMVQSRKNENYGYWNYAQNFTYNATGAVTSMQLGNGKWESTQFNARLQPTQIALGAVQNGTDKLKLEYGYGSTQNNGNVLSQQITVNRSNQSPLAFNQTYEYDSLNRIKSAEEKTDAVTNWKQTFVFDRYGNRNFDTSGNNTTTLPENFDPAIYNPTITTSNNRFTSGQGWAYDAAGNVITDAEGRTFTYDGENKQIEVENSSETVIGTYYFDGDGKRVKKVVPGTGEVTIFVYDASGRLIGEYSTIVESTQDANVQYLTADHLGSPRITTDQNGNVVSRTDYMPYGEEVVGLGNRSSADKYVADNVRQGFTGYEKDNETGLDFAQARMYSFGLGRFTTVDRASTSAKGISPQSWNRYIYVLNNPLIYTDPTGLIWVKEEGCDSDQCRPIWIADKVWEEMSDGDRGDYEVWTDMEYDSVDGRIRLDPNGPSEGNQGWEKIGPNLGNPGYLMLGTAAVVSQADTPVPGPADIAAIGIAIFALYEISLYTKYGIPFDDDPNLYSVSKHNKALVEGLIGAAETEIGKLATDPPEFGPRNHHKGEIKAMLDRAKNIADRLKGKTKEKIKEKIKQLEDKVQDVAPDN